MYPNDTEAELLTGLIVSTDAQVERAARQLQRWGARTVVLTKGERGALLLETSGPAVNMCATTVNAVDTTGAGDAFVGSLATFLAEGQTLAGAVRWANVVAGDSVTRMGTQVSFPRRGAIAHRLTA